MRKNILLFVTSISHSEIVGGTLGRVQKWATRFDKSRYNLHILISGPSLSKLRLLQREFSALGIHIEVVEGLSVNTPLKIVKSLFFLLKFIRREKIELIHSIFIQSDLLAATAKFLSPSIKIVSSLEGALYPLNTFRAKLYSPYYKLIRSRIDRVIALCLYTKNQAIREYGVPANKVSVVYSGIEINETVTRNYTDKSDSRVVIGFLGSIDDGKCIDLFVDVAFALLERGKNVKFVIGGTGPKLQEIKERISNSDYSFAFEVRGFVRDKANFFGSIDVLLFLSLREGLPWVVLESLSYMTPVIASPVGGVPEVVMQGYNGFLLESHDVDYIYHLLCNLIWRKDELSELGHNGCRLVGSRFSPKNEMDGIYAIYDTLI